MKKNATLTEYDPFIIKVYSAEEADDMFGHDYIEDYGVYLPQDLLDRYKKVSEEFWLIQKQLRGFKL